MKSESAPFIGDEAKLLGPFDALGHTFEIAVHGVDDELDTLLRGLATDLPAKTFYALRPVDGDEPGVLWRDGKEVWRSNAQRNLHEVLLWELQREVWACATEPLIHGTTLTLHGRGVLIVGKSGDGKSTIAGRLMGAGASLVAEDASMLDDRDRVRPYPRPLALHEDSLDLLGHDPADRCGCGKRLLPAQALGSLADDSPPITLVARVDHRSQTLERQSPLSMLAGMYRDGLLTTDGSVAHWDQLCRVVARSTCLEVGTSDLEVAAAWITDAASRHQKGTETHLVERTPAGVAAYLSGEALLIREEEAMVLNSSAASIFIQWCDGAAPSSIARSLDLKESHVREVLDRVATAPG